MMLQIKFKGLAIQLQSPFFCANSNTQRVMHDQPPARKLFQILLHFGKSARYFSKLDTAPQDARKPFICPNISHNLPLCPVSNLIFQTSTIFARTYRKKSAFLSLIGNICAPFWIFFGIFRLLLGL